MFGPYDDIQQKVDDRFLVLKGDKYGFLNKEGIESFPLFSDEGLIDESAGILSSLYVIKRDYNLYNKNNPIASNIMIVSKSGESIEINIGNNKLSIPYTENMKKMEAYMEEMRIFDIIVVFQSEKINVIPVQYENEWYLIKLK